MLWFECVSLTSQHHKLEMYFSKQQGKVGLFTSLEEVNMSWKSNRIDAVVTAEDVFKSVFISPSPSVPATLLPSGIE